MSLLGAIALYLLLALFVGAQAASYIVVALLILSAIKLWRRLSEARQRPGSTAPVHKAPSSGIVGERIVCRSDAGGGLLPSEWHTRTPGGSGSREPGPPTPFRRRRGA